jgi:type IV pilus assembly protein PilQ
MSKKRTLNISHGFAEVSSLISSAFGGEVYTDENNGLVIFTGVSDSQMVELKPLILNTVQPKKMVEIKAMVIDNKVLDNLNQSYGVSFSANSENGSFSLDNDGFSFDGSILSFTDYSNLLDLLTNKLSIGISTTGAQENSDDNSIIKPYITTLSGEQASINIGENYKYRIPTTDASGNVVEQILNVPIGNLLNIRPTVNHDDTITMEISVEISSLAGFSSDGLPNTNTRNVTSIVTVNDKDTIVMGGLQGESKNYSQEKLPFFGDLPIIGKLFTWEIENNDNRSVTIFITPRIIETKGKPMQVFGQNIE